MTNNRNKRAQTKDEFLDYIKTMCKNAEKHGLRITSCTFHTLRGHGAWYDPELTRPEIDRTLTAIEDIEEYLILHKIRGD